MSREPLLVIDDLCVCFGSGAGAVAAVRGASLTVDKGESVALVGESGSGKSVTALSVLQLLPYPLASHPRGSIRLDATELVGASRQILSTVRGARISMIFQEPSTALSPLQRIGQQMVEALQLHEKWSKKEAWNMAENWLEKVRIPDAGERMFAYPHQLSGGMQQRVGIA